MKKGKVIRARVAAEDKAAFEKACEEHRIDVSHVVRDLCMAAIEYMAEQCPKGRWISPKLIPYGTPDNCQGAAARGDSLKVANSSRIPLLPTK